MLAQHTLLAGASNLPYNVALAANASAPNVRAIMRETGMDQVLASDQLVKHSLTNPADFLDRRQVLNEEMVGIAVNFSREINTRLNDFLGANNFPELRNELGRKLATKIVETVFNKIDGAVNPVKSRLLEKLTYTNVEGTQGGVRAGFRDLFRIQPAIEQEDQQ